MSGRLIEFIKLIRKCLQEHDERITSYIRIESSGITTIEPALVEAAATAAVGNSGFVTSALLRIAEALSSRWAPVEYVPRKRRKPKKPTRNNGGRPPDAVSPEQMLEWHRDMARRGYIRQSAELPPELRRK